MQIALDAVANGSIEVRDDGTVWRLTSNGKPIEPRRIESVCPKGYFRITLGIPGHASRTKSVRTHRLVWTLANGPIPEGLQVNHKDHDKQNNRLGNLELTTQSENMRHSYTNPHRPRQRPWSKATHWRGKSRVSEETAEAVRQARKSGELLKTIAARFHLSTSHVHRICGATK
jgi:hypothetical protein